MFELGNQYREIKTNNLESLAQFQPGKNRNYLQLKSGDLCVNYSDVNLGSAQIIREKLNIGGMVQATPNDQILAFAFPLLHSGNFRFCGEERINNAFCKASGGRWQMAYDDNLDYFATVFFKDYFNKKHLQIFNQPASKELFESRIIETSPTLATSYSNKLNTIMRIAKNIDLRAFDRTVDLLCSETLQVTLDALLHNKGDTHFEKSERKRSKGIKKVIEYLDVNAHLLPDIAELCKVAALSERSLQYGFLELLNVTPIQYLRLVRLNGARKQLQNSSKASFRVLDVALNWGFIELGRFSKEYKAMFYESPSNTQRLP